MNRIEDRDGSVWEEVLHPAMSVGARAMAAVLIFDITTGAALTRGFSSDQRFWLLMCVFASTAVTMLGWRFWRRRRNPAFYRDYLGSWRTPSAAQIAGRGVRAMVQATCFALLGGLIFRAVLRN